MSSHTHLSPSGWDRWSNCSGSAAFLADIPEPPTSKAAAEGTRAHLILEKCLIEKRDATPYVNSLDEHSRRKVPADMAPAVQEALDYIRARLTDGCKLVAEKKVSLDHVSPGEKGTCDVQVLHADGWLDVFDYKHGVGVPVDGENNGQTLLYALGGMRYWELRGVEIIGVRTHIMQPRRPDGLKFQEQTHTAADLFDFLRLARAAAKRTKEPNAPLKPGPWCDKTFCKGRATCPALKAAVDQTTRNDFGEPINPADLKGGDLAERYKSIPLLRAWIKGVEEQAETEARAGRLPAGLKWVRGRGSRGWAASEAETIAALARLTNLEFAPRKLVTVAQAEKIGGKTLKTQEGFKSLWKSAPGAPKLAPVEDPREAITPAADDFDVMELGDE